MDKCVDLGFFSDCCFGHVLGLHRIWFDVFVFISPFSVVVSSYQVVDSFFFFSSMFQSFELYWKKQADRFSWKVVFQLVFLFPPSCRIRSLAI